MTSEKVQVYYIYIYIHKLYKNIGSESAKV